MPSNRINQEIDLWEREWILRACFIQIGELYTDSPLFVLFLHYYGI